MTYPEWTYDAAEILKRSAARIAELEATFKLLERRLASSEELRTGLVNSLHGWRTTLARDLDPLCPPDGDYLLNAIHADIQNRRPDIPVEHRNVVLHAVSEVLRTHGQTASTKQGG